MAVVPSASDFSPVSGRSGKRVLGSMISCAEDQDVCESPSCNEQELQHSSQSPPYSALADPFITTFDLRAASPSIFDQTGFFPDYGADSSFDQRDTWAQGNLEAAWTLPILNSVARKGRTDEELCFSTPSKSWSSDLMRVTSTYSGFSIQDQGDRRKRESCMEVQGRDPEPGPLRHLQHEDNETEEAHHFEDGFWECEGRMIASSDFSSMDEFVQHLRFPSARVRRIMKSVPQVRLVTFDSVLLLNKAAEIYVRELTTASVQHTTVNGNRLLQVDDVRKALQQYPPKERKGEPKTYGTHDRLAELISSRN